VGTAVLMSDLGEIIPATSYSEFTEIISKVISGITTADLLLEVTLSLTLRINKNQIAFELNMSSSRLMTALQQSRALAIPPINPQLSNIIDDDRFSVVLSWLPSRYETAKPTKVYLSAVNGLNLW
jgi:hypothetical protein